MKRKVLYIMQLPPPAHGASKINQFVYQSNLINQKIEKYLVELNFCEKIAEIGKFSLKKIVLYLKIIKKIVFILNREKPEYAYFTANITGKTFARDLLIIFILKIFKIKIIYHLHGKGVLENSRSRIMKFLYKFCFNNSFIITVSPILAKNEFSQIPLRNSPIFWVENGIETISDLTLYFSNKEPSEKSINLLFLSVLIPSKGLYVLLDALALLKKKNIPFHLDVVGAALDPSEPNKISAYIKDRHLEQAVALHGPIYDDKKYAFFAQTDIFIHPTLNDSFGLVILEAMQFSKPVISTYEGGIPHIIVDGVTGFLVEKNNSTALAEKIQLLIEDETLRNKMGAAGYQRFLEKFTLSIFEKNMKTVFDAILQNNS